MKSYSKCADGNIPVSEFDCFCSAMLYSDCTKDIENLYYKNKLCLVCRKCVAKIIYICMVLVL